MGQKYKPKRDISIAVRELKSLSPTEIVQWIKNHRTKRDNKTGKRIQEVRKPHSISMFFQRNPQIYNELKNEIAEEEISEEQVNEALLVNGNFREIPCVKQWIIDLTNSGAKEDSITNFLNDLKRICRGVTKGRGKTEQFIEGWGLKHPKQLSLEDAKLFIYEKRKTGLGTRASRLTLRNFLQSKGIVVRRTDISGKEEDQAGKYSDLYATKEEIYRIFEWLESMNREAYMASVFAYKTGTRLSAVLNADASFLNTEKHRITVFEKASKGKKKRRLPKQIPKELWDGLKDREGKLFRIDPQDLNNLLRSAYNEVIPKISKRIPMPFHFWRHMFAQHMLRETNMNYGLVAKLGGWTVGALEKYYGKMDYETALEMGKDTLESI